MSVLFEKAKSYIVDCYRELQMTDHIPTRIQEIEREISSKGTYQHTFTELEHGAKMAWRNSNKCIGRLFWDTLTIRDARHLEQADDIFIALEQHLNEATNGGKIKPTITVFAPKTEGEEIKILNHQLIRYAGYESGLGAVGDPISISFTKKCEQLGWVGEKTNFDILPLVIQLKSGEIVWKEIPHDTVLEVEIEHPEFPEFADLNLKWYAVPAVSDMMLEIGGLEYTAAPFNGWYMGTEIGARNLADIDRYNMLIKVATILDLDTKRNSYLWKDRALVELNRAVLYSYQKAGVSIVDHHTAAEQFKNFEMREEKSGRDVTGRWSWLIPPISPAATHIFHKRYEDKIKTPNFFHQK
ncbi:nitric oxide synthase oxygenase [Evansella sp. AB-rgal1]|uniref:nitric oxide synthase oxygenase n=1 Tax=Evansella sp. AB-rgal1 TaxID=3242696 RepID=UPI00359D25BF